MADRITGIVSVMILVSTVAFGQNVPVDSIYKRFSQYWQDKRPQMADVDFTSIDLDSTAKATLKNAFSLPDTTELLKKIELISKPSVQVSTKRFLDFAGGYVSYSWNFRSNIDTPFTERDISQHLVTSHLNFTIAQSIPVRLTYFERQSNSAAFRDFRDLRVEFNAPEFQKLQVAKLKSHFEGMADKMLDPFLKPAINISKEKLGLLNNWLNQTSVVNELIKSKELIQNAKDLKSTDYKTDSALLKKANDFVELYDKMRDESGRYRTLYDSLQKAYYKSEQSVSQVKKLLTGNLNDPGIVNKLNERFKEMGLQDKRLKKLVNAFHSIRKFAVGRTIPDFSILSLRNLNVNGVNFEYNRNRLYLAIAAGTVDFRARDFIYNKQKRIPQYVYSARIGYGQKEGNNIIATYFRGQKQVLGSSNNSTGTVIYGITLATQLRLAKNHLLNAEIAQSAAPNYFGDDPMREKPSIDFNDETNRAYSLKLRSYFPETRTKLEGFYQYSGINFQSFSSYRVNAAAESWYIRVDQHIWKRQLQLSALIRKNDFSNPFVLQRYDANTAYKSFSASFRKRGWPVLSAGYLPSSQYTVIDDEVFENHYQMLNASVTHQYRIGTAYANSALVFNRFYNDNTDSGFLYYNATNFFFNQSIQFRHYLANINISRTDNGSYTLHVWEAGFSTKVLKQSMVGAGVKINHINPFMTKVGLYGNTRIAIPEIGTVNIWIEKNHLPASGHRLVKNEFYTIGFTRFFK